MTNLLEGQTHGQIPDLHSQPLRPTTCFISTKGSETPTSYSSLPCELKPKKEGNNKYNAMNWGFIFFLGPHFLRLHLSQRATCKLM